MSLARILIEQEDPEDDKQEVLGFVRTVQRRVWLAVVIFEMASYSTYAARTREELDKLMREYCLRNWRSEDPMPPHIDRFTDQEVIRMYFGLYTGEHLEITQESVGEIVEKDLWIGILNSPEDITYILSATEEGVRRKVADLFLKWWHDDVVEMPPDDVDSILRIYHEARPELWLDIREVEFYG